MNHFFTFLHAFSVLFFYVFSKKRLKRHDSSFYLLSKPVERQTNNFNFISENNNKCLHVSPLHLMRENEEIFTVKFTFFFTSDSPKPLRLLVGFAQKLRARMRTKAKRGDNLRFIMFFFEYASRYP